MKPSEVAPRLRGAATDEERARAREDLAAAIHELVKATVARFVRGTDAADLAQEITIHALEWIEAGKAIPGKEDAFVRRVAHTKAIDHHRRRAVRRKRETLGSESGWEERTADPGETPDAESARLDREEREEVRLTADRLLVLLAEAPKSYKDILEQHCIDGVSLEDLAQRELDTRDVDLDDSGALARERKRARNVVDQRYSRARKWLQLAAEREAKK